MYKTERKQIFDALLSICSYRKDRGEGGGEGEGGRANSGLKILRFGRHFQRLPRSKRARSL